MTLFAMFMSPDEAHFFGTRMGSETCYHIVHDYGAMHDAVEAGATRLISFCQRLIVPPSVLSRLPGQCLNFHPGPPELPGRNPAFRAAEMRARTFGVTFHTMTEKVDAGPIHEVRRFPLQVGATPEDIEVLAYQSLLNMIVQLAPVLADVHAKFEVSGETWLSQPFPSTRPRPHRSLRPASGSEA